MVVSGERTPSNSTSVGSTSGRSSSGTGTMPQSGQWIMGIGTAPVALPGKHPSPVADSWSGAARDLSLSRASAMALNASVRTQAIKLTRVDRACRRAHIGANREVAGLPLLPHLHRVLSPERWGSLYLLANSQSRWSWPGTAMTRAGAIFHQDTKFATQTGRLVPGEGVHDFECPFSTPALFHGGQIRLGGGCLGTGLRDKTRQRSSSSAQPPWPRGGARLRRPHRLLPKSVSGRVV